MARFNTEDGVGATARVTTEVINAHVEEFALSVMGHTERLRSALVLSLSAKLGVSSPNAPIPVPRKIPQPFSALGNTPTMETYSDIDTLSAPAFPKLRLTPQRLPALRPVESDSLLPMPEFHLDVGDPQGQAGRCQDSFASIAAFHSSLGARESYPLQVLREDLEDVIQKLTSMRNHVGLDVAPFEATDAELPDIPSTWAVVRQHRQRFGNSVLEKQRKLAHMSKLAQELEQASEVRGYHLMQEFFKYWFHSKAKMPNTLLARMVEGRVFFAIFMIVIVFNGAWIGFSTAKQVQDPSFQSAFEAKFVDAFFFACFGLELLFKLAGLQWFFFVAADWKWNLFDALIVLSSIPDVLSMPGSSVRDYVRMAKVLKLFRLVKLFPELTLMLRVLVCALDTLLWVGVLLAFFSFCFSIAIMQSTIGFIKDATTPQDLETVKLVQRDYGSIYKSCLSMFHIISGGDWYDVMSSLRRVSWGFDVAFALYVFCMTFGVLNIVIGTFCEKAASAVERERDLRTRREKEDRDTFKTNMGVVFKEMDVGRTGKVDLETFLAYVDDENKSHYLRSYGIHTHSAHALFKWLDEIDEDPDGLMDMASFVTGMEQMTGHARAMDILFLQQDIGEIKRSVKQTAKKSQLVCCNAGPKTLSWRSDRSDTRRGATNTCMARLDETFE